LGYLLIKEKGTRMSEASTPGYEELQSKINLVGPNSGAQYITGIYRDPVRIVDTKTIEERYRPLVDELMSQLESENPDASSREILELAAASARSDYLAAVDQDGPSAEECLSMLTLINPAMADNVCRELDGLNS
jgi:hypothetical protein